MYGFPITHSVFKSRFQPLRVTCLKDGLTPAACGAALLAPASPGRTALRKRSKESPLLEREVQRFIKASTTVKSSQPFSFSWGGEAFFALYNAVSEPVAARGASSKTTELEQPA